MDLSLGDYTFDLGPTFLIMGFILEEVFESIGRKPEDDYNVYLGATFNLSHKLRQMLVFRPRNRFEELDNVYLAGGGTSPGSGLPTRYQSAVISSNYIIEDAQREDIR